MESAFHFPLTVVVVCVSICPRADVDDCNGYGKGNTNIHCVSDGVGKGDHIT